MSVRKACASLEGVRSAVHSEMQAPILNSVFLYVASPEDRVEAGLCRAMSRASLDRNPICPRVSLFKSTLSTQKSLVAQQRQRPD